MKIRSSVLQSRCPGCMLPFSYKTVYGIDVSLHLLHKDKCYCITRKSPLYQCVCHTTSGGRHFTPNSKDDCLPCFLFSIPITLLVFSLIGFNYLCTSKYYGHVYNFFRQANPLRGGLGLGTRDICG